MLFLKRCWGFVVPLLVLICAVPVLYACKVSSDTIFVISQGGTALIVVGTLLYIVFIDSKKRWPGVNAFQRYARVVTFYRG